MRNGRRPRTTWAAQFVLSLVPPALQVLYILALAAGSQACAPMSDAAVIAFPSLFLGLLANEVERTQ